MPVKVLSAVFRRVLCTLLEDALVDGRLMLRTDGMDFKTIKDRCYATPWVVYCKKPFSNAHNLIRYLGNYTHRVAISNHRLIAHENGKVRFTYKEYKSGGTQRILTLDAHEFIRRFMQHILPTGFSKIRYFGFLALSTMKANLTRCYELVGSTGFLPVLEGLTGLEVFRVITSTDPSRCPSCKSGIMQRMAILLPVDSG